MSNMNLNALPHFYMKIPLTVWTESFAYKFCPCILAFRSSKYSPLVCKVKLSIHTSVNTSIIKITVQSR